MQGQRNVQRFRGGLVFKAHRRVYHSTLGLRVIKKKRADLEGDAELGRGLGRGGVGEDAHLLGEELVHVRHLHPRGAFRTRPPAHPPANTPTPWGRPHQTKCRGVTYPESYITKYTTYTKEKPQPLTAPARTNHIGGTLSLTLNATDLPSHQLPPPGAFCLPEFSTVT